MSAFAYAASTFEAGVGLLLPHQIPPEHFKVWLLLAGRGAGKSHGGARWLNDQATQVPGSRYRIIGPTFGDAVDSCVEGPSGILDANPSIIWRPGHAGGAQLTWPNGSICKVLGTPTLRDVNRLRAITNIDGDWFEELAANPQQDEAWRQASLSRRAGAMLTVCTTTPRPTALIRRLAETAVVTQATARDNPHLPPAWIEELEAEYAGTRLYRQEVLGEIIDTVEGALWTLEVLADTRVEVAPELIRVAVGVDPPATVGTCGIVVSGLGRDGHIYVLGDHSMKGTPEQWASKVAEVAAEHGATVVAEVNQGGAMVTSVLKAAGAGPVRTVHAAKAKRTRAEPVALQWERGRGHMVGMWPALEDQMATWVPGEESPDRLDAAVWSATWLLAQAGVKVGGLHAVDVS